VTPPQPSTFNYQALTFWFSIVNFVVMSGVAIMAWWSGRDKITSTRFKDAEDRIIKLETEVKHPPACTYHAQLELRIDAVRSDTSEIKGTVKGINHAVDLMNEFLINQGGKK